LFSRGISRHAGITIIDELLDQHTTGEIAAWRRAGIVSGTRYNDKGEFLYDPPDPANPPDRPKTGRRPNKP
jgi:hypothetical protein